MPIGQKETAKTEDTRRVKAREKSVKIRIENWQSQ